MSIGSRGERTDDLQFFSVRLVAQQNDPGTERLCLHKFQSRLASVFEEALSAPQNNRIDQEMIFIDEVMLHQRVYKIATAEDQDALTGLLLQLGYFFRDIVLDQP